MNKNNKEQVEEVNEIGETPEKVKKSRKDDGNTELRTLIQTIINQQQELSERLNEMEKRNTTTSADALIRMVNLTYDTDDRHLPELTRIPINAARPHALGMMLESLFDEDIQQGTIPLSRKLRNYYFRLMRSVGGIHLGRGVRLAESQAEAEEEKAEEMELGGE